MADATLPPAHAGTATGSGPAPAVAKPNPPGPTATTPAPTPAAVTAPLFGGYVGGRPRKDGLKPGSPEALAADREKDRLRKARSAAAARASAAAANPAPLPAAVPGSTPPPAPGVGTGPSLPPAGVAGPLPWEAGTLKPLFDQLIPAVEVLTVRAVTDRADKARLPVAVVKEIERDAAWNEPAKKAIAVAAPQVAAKWLNKSGLSAENQPELVLGTAVAALLVHQNKVLSRLDKLIAANTAAAKAEEKKPEAKP